MANTEEAWWNAEQVCGLKLIDLLGGNLNSNAFIGEMPKDVQYSEDDGQWFFEVSGGGTPLDYETNMGSPGGFQVWKMGARLTGVFQTRRIAMMKAGMIRKNLPVAEDSLDGVLRFRRAGEPTIEQGTYPRRSDQAVGGDIRVWRIELELEVWFRPAPAP